MGALRAPSLLLLLVGCARALVPTASSRRTSLALGATRQTHALTSSDGDRSECLELPTKHENRRTFVFRESAMLTIETCSFYEGKLGHAIWPAAVAAAIWAGDRPELFAGKTVLELGSGVGTFGIAVAALTPATRVVLSDLDAADERDFDAPTGLLAAQRRNAANNGLESVSSMRLDWDDAGAWGDETFDVVLAADCVYSPEAVEPLARAISHHLADDGVGYVLSMDRDWSDAKYPRAAPADLEAELRRDLAVARSDWTATTASGDAAAVLLEVRKR